MMMIAAMRARSSSAGRWRAVADLAARQDGVVEHRQLIALGVSPSAIVRWTADARLHRVHHGVYAVGHRSITPLGRVRAGVFGAGDAALASHTTAAALWDLGRGLPSAVHVIVPMACGARSRRGLVVHHSRTLVAADRGVRRDIAVTSLGRTLADLGWVIGPRTLRRAFARAERAGILDMDEIAEVLERCRGGRGPRRLREVVRSYDPRWARVRSTLELTTLEVLDAHGLPAPSADDWIDGRFHADLLWRNERVILEVDGAHFHSSPGDRRHDAWRERELRRLGFVVLRAPEDEIRHRPERLVARVRLALREREPPPPVR